MFAIVMLTALSMEDASRAAAEATFSPDEEEDDHAAKDIEVSMGRTSITMAMPMTGEAPQVEGSIAATPAPKEMRPSPRRIHFAEEVESTRQPQRQHGGRCIT